MTELTETKPSLSTLPVNRLNLLLIGALVVQVIIAAIVFWPRGAATAGEPLLGDVASDDVTALTITNAEGETLTLVKEGEEWVLPDAGNFPALTQNVTELLDKLVAIESGRLVARTAESHARLQVAEDDFVNKVELTTGDGTETLYVGSAPNTGATNVRLGGQNNTYLTNQVNSWELNIQPSSWIDALYFSVTSNNVSRLELQNAQGTFTFERSLGEDDTPGDWALAQLGEDQALDQSTVTTLLSRVNNLRMVEPVGTEMQPEYGLDEPLSVVTLTEVDDEGTETVHTLHVGAQDSDGNYYVQSAGSEYVVLVASFTGDALNEQTLDDFVAQPPATEEGSEDGAATDESTGAEDAAFPTLEGAEPEEAAPASVDDAGAPSDEDSPAAETGATDSESAEPGESEASESEPDNGS